MKTKKYIIRGVLLVFNLSMLTQAQMQIPTLDLKSKEPITFGVISDPAHVQECGCNFYLPGMQSNKFFYGEGKGDGSNAWVNIDGKDVDLVLEKTIRPHKTRLKKGDQFTEIYTGSNVTLKIVFTLLTVCDPSNDNCEAEWMNARLTMTMGARTGKIDLTGVCGCG